MFRGHRRRRTPSTSDSRSSPSALAHVTKAGVRHAGISPNTSQPDGPPIAAPMHPLQAEPSAGCVWCVFYDCSVGCDARGCHPWRRDAMGAVLPAAGLPRIPVPTGIAR
jgi:hypothetical protein